MLSKSSGQKPIDGGAKLHDAKALIGLLYTHILKMARACCRPQANKHGFETAIWQTMGCELLPGLALEDAHLAATASFLLRILLRMPLRGCL